MNALEPVISGADHIRRNAVQAFSRPDRIGDALRAVRAEARARPFRIFFAVVSTLTLLYYYGIATPQYASDSQFAVKSKAPVMAVPLLSAITGQPPSGLTELTAIQQYIQSPELLTKLDAKLHLRDQYTAPRLDFFYYLSRNASELDFLKFYKSMISVDIDTDSNIVTLEARAFDAQTAQRLATTILQESSSFIDRLSDQMRQESMRAAMNDLKVAMTEDKKARTDLTNYRAVTGNLDPVAAGSAAEQSIITMEADIDRLNTQLASLKTYSTENSPQVQQLLAQIKYLQDKIAEVRKTVVTNGQQPSYNQALARFEELSIAQDYADKRLTVAEAAYDQAKSDADQKNLFVVSVTHPNLPDLPTVPTRLWSSFSVILIACALYAVLRLGLAGIRDHQG